MMVLDARGVGRGRKKSAAGGTDGLTVIKIPMIRRAFAHVVSLSESLYFSIR